MPNYADARYGVTQLKEMPGGGGTSFLLSPAGTATAAGTSTLTIAGQTMGLGIAVKIRQIIYNVKTVQTGAGDNVTFNLYVDTATDAAGSLTVTTEGASAVCTSTFLNANVAAGKTFRIDAVAVQTASGEKAAYGYLTVTYQQLFDNVER